MKRKFINGINWECDCKDGLEQSPIDIPHLESGLINPSHVKPVFKYVDAEAVIKEDSEDGSFKKDDNVLFIHTGGSPALYAYQPTILAE